MGLWKTRKSDYLILEILLSGSSSTWVFLNSHYFKGYFRSFSILTKMPKNSWKLYRQKALENILIHWLCHILHGLLYYLPFNTSVFEKLYCTYNIDYFYCIFWKFHKAYFITFFFLPQIAPTSLHFIHPSSCPFPTLKRKEKKKSYPENMEAGLCGSTTPENGACSWGWLI